MLPEMLFSGSADAADDAFDAIEHELMHGLAIAENAETALLHFQALCGLLSHDVVAPYFGNNLLGHFQSKWNMGLEQLYHGLTPAHLETTNFRLYSYELLIHFQEDRFRLAGFNLGQMMHFVSTAQAA